MKKAILIFLMCTPVLAQQVDVLGGYNKTQTVIQLQTGQGVTVPGSPIFVWWYNEAVWPNFASDPKAESATLTGVNGDSVTLLRGLGAQNHNSADNVGASAITFVPAATFTPTFTPTNVNVNQGVAGVQPWPVHDYGPFSFTPTPTNTLTLTFTPSYTTTPTFTGTLSPTVWLSYTATPTFTFTNTYTFTNTPTPVLSPTPFVALSGPVSVVNKTGFLGIEPLYVQNFSPTNTWTPTITSTPTNTFTPTNTPTIVVQVSNPATPVPYLTQIFPYPTTQIETFAAGQTVSIGTTGSVSLNSGQSVTALMGSPVTLAASSVTVVGASSVTVNNLACPVTLAASSVTVIGASSVTVNNLACPVTLAASGVTDLTLLAMTSPTPTTYGNVHDYMASPVTVNNLAVPVTLAASSVTVVGASSVTVNNLACPVTLAASSVTVIGNSAVTVNNLACPVTLASASVAYYNVNRSVPVSVTGIGTGANGLTWVGVYPFNKFALAVTNTTASGAVDYTWYTSQDPTACAWVSQGAVSLSGANATTQVNVAQSCLGYAVSVFAISPATTIKYNGIATQ